MTATKWTETILAVSGLSLLWWAAGWAAAMGVFLMIFANNFSHERRK